MKIIYTVSMLAILVAVGSIVLLDKKDPVNTQPDSAKTGRSLNEIANNVVAD